LQQLAAETVHAQGHIGELNGQTFGSPGSYPINKTVHRLSGRRIGTPVHHIQGGRNSGLRFDLVKVDIVDRFQEGEYRLRLQKLLWDALTSRHTLGIVATASADAKAAVAAALLSLTVRNARNTLTLLGADRAAGVIAGAAATSAAVVATDLWAALWHADALSGGAQSHSELRPLTTHSIQRHMHASTILSEATIIGTGIAVVAVQGRLEADREVRVAVVRGAGVGLGWHAPLIALAGQTVP